MEDVTTRGEVAASEDADDVTDVADFFVDVGDLFDVSTESSHALPSSLRTGTPSPARRDSPRCSAAVLGSVSGLEEAFIRITIRWMRNTED